MSKLDEKGREVLDTAPMALPVKFNHEPSMAEMVQQQIRVFMSQEADKKGMETFEEAEDFDVDDDYDPSSPWELDFDPVEQKQFFQDQKEGTMKEEVPIDQQKPPVQGGKPSGGPQLLEEGVSPSEEAEQADSD